MFYMRPLGSFCCVKSASTSCSVLTLCHFVLKALQWPSAAMIVATLLALALLFPGSSPPPICWTPFFCFLLSRRPSGGEVGYLLASHKCKQTLQFWAPHWFCMVALRVPCVPCLTEFIFLCKNPFICGHILPFLSLFLSLTCFFMMSLNSPFSFFSPEKMFFYIFDFCFIRNFNRKDRRWAYLCRTLK